jgi:uncharacterized membrane protein
MPEFKQVVEGTGLVIEGAGVLVIVVGLVVASARFVWLGLRGEGSAYQQFRQDLGRGILLGLEFLVAGDIIRTVAVDPNLQNVLVLAVIVLVRTFLSMSLQVELEGRWPGQKADEANRPDS